MKKTANFYVLCLFLASSISFAQDVKEKHEKAPDSLAIYLASESAIYPVYDYVEQPISNTPKNIILMIGDGMGLTQISAGQTANKGEIFLQNFKHIGFCKTHSSNSYTTDSAAGGTALSTGVKTYNGAVGVDQDKKPIANVCEMAHHIGLKTGIISTSSITDATPAAFLAHQPSRKMHEEIALDCTNSSVDIIIGTGYKYFTNRKDKKIS